MTGPSREPDCPEGGRAFLQGIPNAIPPSCRPLSVNNRCHPSPSPIAVEQMYHGARDGDGWCNEDTHVLCAAFLTGYRPVHRHSTIWCHTPESVNYGLATGNYEPCTAILEAAYAAPSFAPRHSLQSRRRRYGAVLRRVAGHGSAIPDPRCLIGLDSRTRRAHGFREVMTTEEARSMDTSTCGTLERLSAWLGPLPPDRGGPTGGPTLRSRGVALAASSSGINRRKRR